MTEASKSAPDPRTPRTRKPGRLAGKLWIAPDFDETPEDILAAFEGDLDVQDDPHTGS